MNPRTFTHFVGCVAVSLICSSIAVATPAAVGSGQFNLAGAVYVTNSELLFGYMQAPPNGDQMASVLVPSDGVFSGLKSGELAHIGNVLTPSAGGPVTPGTPFLLNNWITLPNNINADLTDIPLNSNIAVCASGMEGLGSVCRVNSTSPVILQQGITGVTAFLSVMGQAHYAGSTVETPLMGLLSANFTMGADSTIAGLLADYNKNGFIMTGYSGNFSTTASAGVPEPASLGLLSLSLIGLALVGRKKLLS